MTKKNFKTLILFVLLITASCSNIKEQSKYLMKSATPVWVEGRETEMNLNIGFHGVFNAQDNQKVQIRITASTLYRLYLNGEFIGYGPARAAHGYSRVDEYNLTDHIKNGKNIVAVEVAGYNINTYYTIDTPSFLQAEVETEGKIVLATGTNNEFNAFKINERLQKVERYSFQRPFTEYYRLDDGYNNWMKTENTSESLLTLSVQSTIELLPRNLLLPEFEIIYPVQTYSRGYIGFKKPETYYKDRSLTTVSETYKGYMENELETVPSQFTQEIINTKIDIHQEPYSTNFSLQKNEFVVLDYGINLSGFIGGKVSCDKPSKILFYFDEVLTDNDVNTKRRMADVNNQVVYELLPGTYDIETFESYTFKYLKVIILEGECQFHDIYLREYAYPKHDMASFSSSNEKLNAIYDAAWQTYRQNSVDIFMDCPSRERAGWLCDSYFTAIMEKEFTGESKVAHNFYENYALPDSFAFLPDGMLPMCYPSDHYNGNFIPNWAMWFIIQIEDYNKRGGDKKLVTKLRPRIARLLEYFEKFENEDELLEKLEKWIFVEWSKANDFVQDVNFPTNMLYSTALERAGQLYNNDLWLQKSKKIKQTILDKSYNGSFFVDNAVRDENGRLNITNNTTEVCQYYAFFFNIANPETHPELWEKIITEFGPNRDDKVVYPNVFKANAFVGNYLRMDILSRYGLQTQLLEEIQDYFYFMAEQTGTLWENMSSHASCNHGFASYLGHVLHRDVLGVSNIDYLKKEITIRFTDLNLDKCSGVIPVNDEIIELNWKRSGEQIVYSINVPKGYKVKIENLSSYKLVESKNKTL